MTYRVAFIDDHDIVRSGFVQLLSMEDDIQVVGEFSSAEQARAGLPGLNPHICICDISMPDQSGLDLLNDIPSGIGVIMLSMHDSPALVEMALERGAKGFLSKRCKPDDLITAVRTVGGGGVYLMPEIAQRLVQVAVDPLTRREREVAILLAQGMEVREIAESLGLSPKTVHVHRANLFAKLGVSNNVELAKRVLNL
ncbi:transcriptional regulator UhpA [Yersinia nurmii]|uniref:Transcriptional regulatory protein UhpA n=1 Tax=Yersinia nurmii TaxID=685706 RepID=A0AAW7JWN2_9GAMM|nr:transcriptional regulator UhpA [Yersinia nurmii]MDN0086856.1 transcriptional regulator UhpA [Yersinia nurmii]CNE27264.1 two-component system response regulator [Yersinia nurmii]